MVRHIVFTRFKGRSKEIAREAAGKLLALRDKISVLRDIEVGIDFMDSERSYDLALVCTFDSREHLQEYLKHPAHLEVREFIHSVREATASVDYEF